MRYNIKVIQDQNNKREIHTPLLEDCQKKTTIKKGERKKKPSKVCTFQFYPIRQFPSKIVFRLSDHCFMDE